MKLQVKHIVSYFVIVVLTLAIGGCSKREAGKATDIQAQITALKSGDQKAKEDALEALWNAKEKAAPAVPALIETLKDKDPIVRRLACYTLGEIGEQAKSAVPAIKELMNDPDPNVVNQVIVTLNDLDPKTAPKGKLTPVTN